MSFLCKRQKFLTPQCDRQNWWDQLQGQAWKSVSRIVSVETKQLVTASDQPDRPALLSVLWAACGSAHMCPARAPGSHFPSRDVSLQKITFVAENSLFLGKLQTQRKCVGIGTVCWCCMNFGNAFKHSSICLVSTSGLYFRANKTLKGSLRKHGLRNVFGKTTQSLADRAKLFLQGLCSA